MEKCVVAPVGLGEDTRAGTGGAGDAGVLIVLFDDPSERKQFRSVSEKKQFHGVVKGIQMCHSCCKHCPTDNFTYTNYQSLAHGYVIVSHLEAIHAGGSD